MNLRLYLYKKSHTEVYEFESSFERKEITIFGQEFDINNNCHFHCFHHEEDDTIRYGRVILGDGGMNFPPRPIQLTTTPEIFIEEIKRQLKPYIKEISVC